MKIAVQKNLSGQILYRSLDPPKNGVKPVPLKIEIPGTFSDKSQKWQKKSNQKIPTKIRKAKNP